jgi:hypothetical protein
MVEDTGRDPNKLRQLLLGLTSRLETIHLEVLPSSPHPPNKSRRTDALKKFGGIDNRVLPQAKDRQINPRPRVGVISNHHDEKMSRNNVRGPTSALTEFLRVYRRVILRFMELTMNSGLWNYTNYNYSPSGDAN